MRLPPLLALALTACSPQATEPTEHYTGFVEIGEHGPVFNPKSDFEPNGKTREIVPWRLSVSEGVLTKELESILAGKPFGTVVVVDFIGREVPVKPNGDGFDRQVEVSRWIQLRPCRTTRATYSDCLRK